MGACSACGSRLADDARFCPACGAPQSRACDRCGTSNELSASFCSSCGAPLTAPDGVDERKLVTILFADVTGSTALGEQLDPERLSAVLQAYFSTVSAAVASWGGSVEKFIGDAVMAAFGVPAVREDDAERALRAALEMLERLGSLNEEFRQRHGVMLQIRIGVNTGEVIAPSGPSTGQQLVAGDAVNVAARLEQAAEPGRILVGERTYLATRHAFRFGPPVAITVKGKASAVAARELVGDSARGEPQARTLRSPLVGRDRELAMVLGSLDEVIETGSPRLVLISGPAGIGKSRLVAEVARAAKADRPEVRILRGRCLATGHGITFWALGEILRASAGIGLDDPAGEAHAKLRRSAGEILRPLGLNDEELDRTIHALAATAGLTMANSPLEGLDPERMAAELARAWPRFTSALAATAPTVLVIEDLHWAGDQLVETLERVLARSSGALLLIATARPDFTESHPGFAVGRENFSAISLRPLTPLQSSELVDGLLDAAALPAALRAEILGKAEGNPFFVEELLGRLIDEEGLVRERGAWRATGSAEEISLPDSVHGLLAARIDALPPVEKRVLQQAAVVGRVFWEAPITHGGNGSVGTALTALEGRGLVFARPTSSIAGQLEYMFKHALVRDVAYAGLPRARRARAHAEVGAWIEKLAGERIDEFIELVAHHYHAAVAGAESDLAWTDQGADREALRKRAFEALCVAGAGARQRYAVDKALQLHQQALDLSAGTAERRAALDELGSDHLSIYHADEALAAFQEARDLTEPGDLDERARLAERIGRTAVRWGAFRSRPEPGGIERIVQEGLDDTTDEALRASLLVIRSDGDTFWHSVEQPDPVPTQQRVAWGKEALVIAERLDDPTLISRAAAVLARLYYEERSFRAAREMSLRQLDLIDRIASPDVKASILGESSANVLAAGETDRAYSLADHAYDLAREMSDHELMHASAPLLRAGYRGGRWAEILPVVEVHLDAFSRESDVACPEVQTGPALGAVLFANLGDRARADELAGLVSGTRSLQVTGYLAGYDVAVSDAERALDRLRGVEGTRRERPPLFEVVLPRLIALVGLQDWAAVTQLLPLTRDLVDADAMVAPWADLAEGLALQAAGDQAHAGALLRAAAAGFERIGAPLEAAQAREALARSVEPSERRAALESALATYEELNARPHVARVSEALRSLMRTQ
jgi:class 3 adenylate cyclase